MLQIDQAENQNQEHRESRDDFGGYGIAHKIFLSYWLAVYAFWDLHGTSQNGMLIMTATAASFKSKRGRFSDGPISEDQSNQRHQAVRF